MGRVQERLTCTSDLSKKWLYGLQCSQEGHGALYLTPRELIESSFKSGMRERKSNGYSHHR